jgi:hypothetical protein
MAKKWMQSAVKHPGASTAAAKREGVSLGAWAREHEHDSGRTGKRARLAIIFRAQAKKRKGKSRSEPKRKV